MVKSYRFLNELRDFGCVLSHFGCRQGSLEFGHGLFEFFQKLSALITKKETGNIEFLDVVIVAFRASRAFECAFVIVLVDLITEGSRLFESIAVYAVFDVDIAASSDVDAGLVLYLSNFSHEFH